MDLSRPRISGSRGSSGRGERGRDLDEGDSLALLLFGACVSVCWSTIPKILVDSTLVSSWVGWIPVSPSDDNGDDISTIERLASFGGDVSIADVNRVPTCQDKGSTRRCERKND